MQGLARGSSSLDTTEYSRVQCAVGTFFEYRGVVIPSACIERSPKGRTIIMDEKLFERPEKAPRKF